MTALRQEDDAPRGIVTWAEHSAALREIATLRAELDQYREALAADIAHHRLNVVRMELALGRRAGGVVLLLLDHDRALNGEQIATNLGVSRECVRTHVTRIRIRFRERAGIVDAISTDRRGLYAFTKDARQWLSERVPEAFRNGGVR